MVVVSMSMNDSFVAASSKTHKVDLDDFTHYFETGDRPTDSEVPWPEFRTTTIVVDLSPVAATLDNAEVTMFQNALAVFYKSIFDSQSTYNLVIRSVEVVDQILSETTHELALVTVISSNFRPNSDDQELSNDNFHQICYRLVNRFNQEVKLYLTRQHHGFSTVESVRARASATANSNIETPGGNSTEPEQHNKAWPYTLLGIGLLVIGATSATSYKIYK